MTKPSWTTQLPMGWSVERLRHIAEIANSNVDKKSYDDGRPVRLCNYTDVYYNEYITNDLDLMNATATSNEIRRFKLRPGDVIITKDSESWDDIAIPACVDEELENVVCGYHLTLMRTKPRHMTGRFLLRALQAEGVREQFWLAANGVTRFGLGQQGMKDALLPVPPLGTQRAIANFLDEKAKAIDDLIAKKERLIELLEEKCAALINRSVRKGLDADVPMRRSGIPWIGEIPEHWKIRRGKFLFKSLNRGIPDDSGVVTAYRDGQVTLRSNRRTEGYTFAVKEAGYQGVAPGDLVIQSMDAFAGAIGVCDSWGRCSPEYVVLGARAPANNHYYAYLLREMALAGYIQVVTNAVRERAPRFRYSNFAQIELPVPPKAEQDRIAATIKNAERITALQAEISDQITKLREYRQSLITAAVTGQIDVTATQGAAA